MVLLKSKYSRETSRLIQSYMFLGWKRPLRSCSPATNPALPSPSLNCVPKCHIYTLFNVVTQPLPEQPVDREGIAILGFLMQKLAQALPLPCRGHTVIFAPKKWNWRLKPASNDSILFALLWQASENRKLLNALKGLLDDFRSKLRDEERERQGLQQQYALHKAAWEVEMTELRCRLEQVTSPVSNTCKEQLRCLKKQEIYDKQKRDFIYAFYPGVWKPSPEAWCSRHCVT